MSSLAGPGNRTLPSSVQLPVEPQSSGSSRVVRREPDAPRGPTGELPPVRFTRPIKGTMAGKLPITKNMATIVEDYEESRDTREN